jgi:ketosteroid isomerase-like protein
VKTAERQALVDAFERRDLEALLGLMDTNVVWRGVETPDQPTPICHNRAEVRAVFESHLAAGRSGRPEIVAETGDSVVIDPHPEPPVEGMEDLHHVYTFRQGRIVTMQDYLGRDGRSIRLASLIARRSAKPGAKRQTPGSRR